ncbi:MAG: DNA polymerase III subunit delta' [Proteobacteria bacterium]|nr:DNA polymerase III subunit delta' [Pseudomonadota bacterium]
MAREPLSDKSVLRAPRANPELIGHRRAEEKLLGAWRKGRLGHAWLIHGPRGLGKATLAYRFARFVLAAGEGGASREGLAIDPESPLFRRIAAGGHTDLLTLERSPDEKTGALRDQITVDDARRVGAFLALTPGEGGWRVVIVDSADEMNRNAANALLKHLEEPPERVLFLLVSRRPSRLPATIVSRCQRLALRPLGRDEITSFLKAKCPKLTDQEAAVLAAMSEGCPGRALAFAEQGGIALYKEMLTLLGTLPDLDIAGLHRLAQRLAARSAGDEFRALAELVMGCLARLIRSAASAAPASDTPADETALTGRLIQRDALAEWVTLWEKLSCLFADAERYKLDRKQVVLNAFGALQRAAQH